MGMPFPLALVIVLLNVLRRQWGSIEASIVPRIRSDDVLSDQ